MENKELFAPILQEDEEIIKVIKPNKTRYVYLGGLAYTLLALIPILVMAAPLCMAIEAFKENGAPAEKYTRYGKKGQEMINIRRGNQPRTGKGEQPCWICSESIL